MEQSTPCQPGDTVSEPDHQVDVCIWDVNTISDYKTGFMVTALDILGKCQHKYLGTFISDKLTLEHLMDAVIAVFYSGFI